MKKKKGMIKFYIDEAGDLEYTWDTPAGTIAGQIQADPFGRLYTFPTFWPEKFDRISDSNNLYMIDRILHEAEEWMWENDFSSAQLQRFFAERPALRVTAIEREATLGTGTLSKAIKGEKKLHRETIAKLKPVLKKYGFQWG